ncbi:acyl-CoA/acyl-ACP dehydrogenase [Asanoa sp. WMMD1127]|uniref:acyl-CoA dehydrogenase family protein n=1 Tax=Asanoa sp. WMMD1127 TaxID=3016107 RepID=UPI0024177ACA|nr:acyl-CoA dehydrogenase family protein [Asanoa sp. WMMD1127]MDG4826190.1 acyl-CoA/acyl-ACP dehydrogenase [Asanoa sp. WMMD1127]
MSDMLDLLESPDERDLRASVREMLAAEAPWQSVLSFVTSSSPEPFDPKLWRTLATGMGLAGLLVPEAQGGAGAQWRAAAVVVEELGRAVAPVPFLSSAVVATTALGSSEAPDLLGRLASGELTAALAVPYGLWSAPPLLSVPDGAVTGTVRGVADGLGAGLLLVPGEDGLYAVDGAAVRRTHVVSLDETRPLCDLEFSATPARRVGPLAAVPSALRVAATMVAAEQVGLASWCLETTVAYLKERHQFGRPVGSFQGLKHRLADLWVELTQARAVVGYAVADLAAGGEDASVAASLAKVVGSEVAVRAAEECVQMHGGIGFTWEHPAHLYLKRAKATAIAYGSPDRHRARLANLVDLHLEDS